ncbi:nucleoside-diphosphate sugar epimerase [Pseudoclavibacter endophyticus]|uniref:NAD(P)-dependent oxidoreductase n=1 Tax=Pseudoclavibacter endophyticus TaxID=1778590 RepID=A0A6H9WGU1_9MICO|nr:NAD(P)-dependent oxidoreductase [Pseudoclavibacter endophyticus]KAB1650179.1 NAD(P)-dependent oxidoreductase [Pseudoclavibacter endophyticus]GGA56479.1 nucleoside-diphosphate sugar epimerase [Pseudoclavibacter endophyticus]
MPQHVLVTGAAGYIGRHVVNALSDRGDRVTAVVRPGSAERVPAPKRAGSVEAVELDVLAPETDLDALLEAAGPGDGGAPDAFIHLAWEKGFAHAAPEHLLRLSDHYRVLRHAAQAGVGRLAVLGSMHEVGYHEGAITADTPTNPLSLYGIAKDALRRSVFASLGELTELLWLRAYYIYGDDRNNQSIFTKLLEAADAGKTTFPFTTGTRKFDFIRVEELGRQIAVAASQSEVTGVINVSTGTPVSLGEQVEAFIAEHGLDIALEYGAFPDRPYDSPVIYGDATEITQILAADERASRN